MWHRTIVDASHENQGLNEREGSKFATAFLVLENSKQNADM